VAELQQQQQQPVVAAAAVVPQPAAAGALIGPPKGPNAGPIALSNLPLLLELLKKIEEHMRIYVDFDWVQRCAHSTRYVELFEAFDRSLFYWVLAVTSEVTIRTKQDVSDIKQDVSQLHGIKSDVVDIKEELSSLRHLLEANKERERQYAKDAGTRSYRWLVHAHTDALRWCLR